MVKKTKFLLHPKAKLEVTRKKENGFLTLTQTWPNLSLSCEIELLLTNFGIALHLSSINKLYPVGVCATLTSSYVANTVYTIMPTLRMKIVLHVMKLSETLLLLLLIQ